MNYVLIGSLARVLQGTDEIARGVDICPQRKGENLERLAKALDRLDADPSRPRHAARRGASRRRRAGRVRDDAGLLQRRAAPAGTRGGWDDLRRGRRARRSAAASASPSRRSTTWCGWRPRSAARDHAHVLAQLRQIQELELTMGRGIEL